MYAITRSLLHASALRQGAQLSPVAARQITLKVVQPIPEPIETNTEKNERLGRALSPHLTIYKPQLTSMLSISHRGTGVLLTGYLGVLGIGALLSPHDIGHYATMIEGLHMSAATLTAVKFILAYPLAYHTCNGIRHLAWDSGKLLKLKEVYSSGYAMVAASIVVGAILAVI